MSLFWGETAIRVREVRRGRPVVPGVGEDFSTHVKPSSLENMVFPLLATHNSPEEEIVMSRTIPESVVDHVCPPSAERLNPPMVPAYTTFGLVGCASIRATEVHSPPGVEAEGTVEAKRVHVRPRSVDLKMPPPMNAGVEEEPPPPYPMYGNSPVP